MFESAALPIADRIRDADTHVERATILLKLSDAALLTAHADIGMACRQAGFAAGDFFVTWRVTALCRTRDAHGLLPETIAHEVENWRRALSQIAAGTAPAIPTIVRTEFPGQ